MTGFDVYLMMTLPDIADLFCIFSFIFFGLSAAALVGVIACIAEESKHLSKFTKTLCFVVPLAFIFAVLYAVIPDTKTMVMMYALPPVVNDKQVQQLPENLVVYINDFLKKESKDS